MNFTRYLEQARDWPQCGQHILAQFDADSIYVYQAYRPSIANPQAAIAVGIERRDSQP